jgi:hypothetical protein
LKTDSFQEKKKPNISLWNDDVDEDEDLSFNKLTTPKQTFVKTTTIPIPKPSTAKKNIWDEEEIDL